MVSFFTKACCVSDDVIDNLKYISKNSIDNLKYTSKNEEDNLKYISKNEELINEELINEEFRNEEYYKCDNNISYSHRNINGQTVVLLSDEQSQLSDEQSQLSDEQSQNHDKKETTPNCLNPPLGFTR